MIGDRHRIASRRGSFEDSSGL